MPPLSKGGGARLARDGGIQRPQKATETSRTDKDVRPYACIKFILCCVRFFAYGSEGQILLFVFFPSFKHSVYDGTRRDDLALAGLHFEKSAI